MIDNAESGFHVRVSLVVFGVHGGILARDRLRFCFIRFITDILSLDHEVKCSLGLRQALFLSLGITTGHPIVRSKHSSAVSESPMGCPDAGVSDNVWDKPRDSRDDGYPGGTVRVPH